MKSKNITISKDVVIEIVFSSLIPGKEDQFYKDYFPKVFPIVSEYKGNFLFASHVENSYNSEISSHTIAFFDWPNVETFKKIINDSRMPDLLKIRNDALDYINEGNFYKSKQDCVLSFNSDKIYSLSSFKADPHFMDEIKNKNGKILLTLDFVKDSIGNFKKEMLCLAEWNDFQSIDSFYKNIKEYNGDKYFTVSFLMK